MGVEWSGWQGRRDTGTEGMRGREIKTGEIKGRKFTTDVKSANEGVKQDAVIAR